MIKINRNIQSPEIEKAINVLTVEKEKENGDYNKPEVLDALKIVFNKKCYLCENKEITSYNIEHLKSHRDNNKDLKFDWDNLFLSCAHCNNIKLQNYDNILDCSKEDVDEVISFRKKGIFSWEEKIEIEPVKHSDSIDKTVELLLKIYNGTTEMKKLESSNIRKSLRDELMKFINAINEYETSYGEDKEDAKILILKHLKSNSAFCAFKRWIVRDNKINLSEFICDDGMKINLE